MRSRTVLTCLLAAALLVGAFVLGTPPVQAQFDFPTRPLGVGTLSLTSSQIYRDNATDTLSPIFSVQNHAGSTSYFSVTHNTATLDPVGALHLGDANATSVALGSGGAAVTTGSIFANRGGGNTTVIQARDGTNGFPDVQVTASGTGGAGFVAFGNGSNSLDTSIYRQTAAVMLPGTGGASGAGFWGQKVGGNVSSASAITPTGQMFHVTGTTAIATINLPATGFTGCIELIPDGIFTTTTAGNIGLASTAVVSKALHECYDGTKWYPSY